MTERGLPTVDGAPACPFVAFEDDRDERATSPDHRHRCFAESPPAPRALAHQEAYCLASAFPVCPTFQDWARREAARARPAALPPAADDGLDEDVPPLVDDRPPRRQGSGSWSAPPPWLRGSSAAAAASSGTGAGAAGGHPMGDEVGSGSGGPDAAAGVAGAAAGGLAGSFADRLAMGGEPPPAGRPADAWVDREAWNDDAGRGARDAGAVGGAAGVGAAAAGMTGEVPGHATVEDVPMPPRRREHGRFDGGSDDDAQGAHGPAWERPRRLEAYPTLRSRRLSAGIVPPLLIGVIAVVLAGAALFFLPSLFNIGGGSPGGASPSPTTAASGAPLESLNPTVAPAATQQTYTVQSGDTLSKIARKYNVSLNDLIAANQATIPNPDKLKIGDVLIIPTPTPSELPGAS